MYTYTSYTYINHTILLCATPYDYIYYTMLYIEKAIALLETAMHLKERPRLRLFKPFIKYICEIEKNMHFAIFLFKRLIGFKIILEFDDILKLMILCHEVHFTTTATYNATTTATTTAARTTNTPTANDSNSDNIHRIHTASSATSQDSNNSIACSSSKSNDNITYNKAPPTSSPSSSSSPAPPLPPVQPTDPEPPLPPVSMAEALYHLLQYDYTQSPIYTTSDLDAILTNWAENHLGISNTEAITLASSINQQSLQEVIDSGLLIDGLEAYKESILSPVPAPFSATSRNSTGAFNQYLSFTGM